MTTKFTTALVHSCLAVSLLTTLPAIVSAAEPVIAVAEIKHEGDVDFEKEVLPILRKKCLACHNNTESESDLILETPQAILKGGSDGPAAIAGKGLESLLIKLGSHAKDPIMPPKGNDVGAMALTPDELGLLKLWIDQGAKGEVLGASAPIVWQALPPGVHPIYAVAMSPNGQFAAAGRANQVFLYHIPSRRELGRLTDPSLLKSGVYTNPGVADFDLIQALAFSPDNQRLATGGYRTLKIWQRPKNLHKNDLAGLTAAGQSVATSSDGKWIAIGNDAGQVQLYDAATGQLARALTGHTAAITSVEFTPDGAQLYSGSVDKSVRVWNPADGAVLASVETPAEVRALRLINKGTQLATGGSDNIVRIWTKDADKLTAVRDLTGHAQPITSLAVVADNQLASSSADGIIKIWDVAGGKSTKDLNHGGPVTGIVVRADGQRLISAGANNIAKLWNLQNNQSLADLKGDLNEKLKVEELQRAVALSKKSIETAKKDLEEATKRKTQEEENGKKAAETVKTSQEDFNKKTEAAKQPTTDKEAADKALVDATTAKTTTEATKKTAETTATEMAAALTKAQQDKDAATKVANEAAAVAKQAADKLTAAKAAAAADANNAGLAEAAKAAETASVDAEAKNKAAADAKVAAEKLFTDADAAKKAADTAKQQADQAFNAANTAFNQADQKVKQVTPVYQKAIDERNAAMRNFEAAQRSVERAGVAVKTATDSLPGYDAAVKNTEATTKEREAALVTLTAAATAMEKPFKAIALSPDGKTVATAGEGSIVYTWDTETGVAIETFAGHAAPVTALAFTSAGNLVSTAADKAAIVWDLNAPWALERTIGSPDATSPITDRVTAIDFSPDGQSIATGSGEPSRSGELKIWKVADGSLIKEFKEPHSDTIYDVEFSPNGQYIATCGADRFMKVFDIAAGKLHRSYEGHTHHVLGVTWRSDGRMLASSGADNVVKIWNFLTGDQ
ncbi:MAG TPA: c-type cytochrome domain-containing protein, partial [Pirellulaceae bacterium]|nr:c-type cytochrome domain-containing protein [Pirellulaceae bacterium]